jgi:hypothetical protein
MRGLAASMALLGGPVGIAVIAATALLTFGGNANTAEEQAKRLNERIGELEQGFDGLTKAQLNEQLVSTQGEIVELEKKLESAIETQKKAADAIEAQGLTFGTPRLTESISLVRKELAEATARAEALKSSISSLSGSGDSTPGVDTTAGDAQIADEQKTTAALQKERDFRIRFQRDYLEEFYQLERDGFGRQRILIEAGIAEDLQATVSGLEKKRQAIEEDRIKALENESLTKEQRIALENEFNQQILIAKELAEIEQTAIVQRGADDRVAIKKAERDAILDTAANLGNSLLTLGQGQSRKLFELGKVAAISTAVLKARESIPSSYAAGAEIGGPPVGALFAAAAAAATAVQIKSVASTQFGGGGSVGSASTGTASIPTTATSNSTAATPVQNQRFIEIRGIEDNQILTGEQVKSILTESLQSDDDVIIAVTTGQSNAAREGLI